MLCLGLGRLECAGQNRNLGVAYLVGHLRVREVLVHDDALHKDRVLQGPADLAVDLDQLEVDVFPLKVRYRQDGVDSYLGELVVGFGHNLAAQTRPRHFGQVRSVRPAELYHV